MLRDKAFIQNLIPDPRREGEILRDHGILPGNRILRHFRIVVIVPFPDNPVIHGMIRQLQVQRQQTGILILVHGEETHIQVRRGHRDFSGPGGVKRGEGLPHVLHRIGIFQLFPKFDHSVGEGARIHPASGRIRQLSPLAGHGHGQQQQQQPFRAVSHSTILFSVAKLPILSVLKKL